MTVKKSRDYKEFKYLKSNNEQVAELTERHIELKKDLEKFVSLLRVKEYEDNHNKENYDNFQKELNKSVANIKEELANLVQYMGTYTN